MSQDIYLELAGQKTGPVKGETLAPKYLNHLEVMKISFGAVAPEDYATKQASGKMRVDDLEFDTPVSCATSAMMSMLANNESISKCIFKFRKASSTGAQYLYLQVSLSKARFTSIKQTTDGEKQMINAKIGFTKLVFDYYKQKQDGTQDSAPFSVTYDGDTGTTS